MNIKIIPVKKENENLYKSDFIRIYKEVFSEAPYFEKYKDQWIIENVWEIHLNYGLIVVAQEKKKIIGLGCSIFLNHIPKEDPNYAIINFLKSKKLPFNIENTCYMSEIAVLKEYRKKGIGNKIIDFRLSWHKNLGGKYYLMRTASQGSKSIDLYLKKGGQIVENLTHDIGEHAEVVCSASKQRIYIYGLL